MLDDGKLQTAVYAVAAVLLVVGAVRLLSGGGDSGEGPRVALRGADAGRGQERGSGSGVYVHVAGAVRRPGLYRVAKGSRVGAAVSRAGGPLRRAELSGLNLAATLQDGQQVLVPKKGEAAPATATGGAGASGPGGAAAGAAAGGTPGMRVSLASATLEQLDALDGIGPTLAKRILEYRDEHGGFRSLDQLREVEGIGEKRFEALREAVQP